MFIKFREIISLFLFFNLFLILKIFYLKKEIRKMFRKINFFWYVFCIRAKLFRMFFFGRSEFKKKPIKLI